MVSKCRLITWCTMLLGWSRAFHSGRETAVMERDSPLLPAKNLVDRSVRERDDEQIPIGPRLDVGGDAKVPSE
jgi:hypothetical protein